MERLIEVGKVKPLDPKAKKCDKFGVGLEKLDREIFDPSKTYDKLETLGAKYIRLQSGWMRTEKEEGIYDFAWLDDIVDNLIARGMQPWFCLCYGNPLYTDAAKTVYGGVGCPPIFTEREKEAWLKYCQATALHFKGRVNMFEVWNEPDGVWCWKHGVNGTEYGEFCRDTGKAVKEVCPDAKIFGGSYCMWDNGLEWLEAALQTGMGDYIDAITYHEYTIFEQHVFERVDSLRAVLARYGDIKVINGEAGSPSSSRGFGAMRRGCFTPEKQAKLVLRRQIVDLMTDVEFASVFSTVDMVEALGGTTGDVTSYLDYGYFGLLAAQFDENGRSVGTYEPKPSYYALQNLYGVFGEGAKCVELPILHLPKYTLRTYAMDCKRVELINTGFEKANGAQAYVYWKPTQLLTSEFEGTVSFQVAGVAGKEVHLVDLMTGKVYDFPKELMETVNSGVTWFHNIPVKDYPLMITFGDFCEVEK